MVVGASVDEVGVVGGAGSVEGSFVLLEVIGVGLEVDC